MNPRIKELIDQATEQQFDYTASSGTKPGEYYSNYKYVLNPEKFAEAIIKECSAQCAIAGDLALAEQIKYYFGVKE